MAGYWDRSRKVPFGPPIALTNFSVADWPLIFKQISTIGTIALVSAVSTLLNASGMELVAKQDVELNRELRSAGLALIIAGLGGGMVGFHTLGQSSLVNKLGASNRLVGLILAAICSDILYSG